MNTTQDIADQKTTIRNCPDLTPEEKDYLLAWCEAGCPLDEPTDVGFEDGDFA